VGSIKIMPKLFGDDFSLIPTNISDRLFYYLDNPSLVAMTRVNKNWRNKLLRCEHSVFEDLLTETPKINDREAIFCDGRRVLYRELNARINRLARYLRDLQLPDESVVGLYLHQSLEYVVSMLATMKAGLAFMPLSHDGDLSVERLIQYTQGSNLRLIITQSKFNNNAFLQVPQIKSIPKINFDELEPTLIGSVENLRLDIKPRQLAYVLNTSGSTGVPKKVLIEHNGLYCCMLAVQQVLGITQGDKIAAFADIGFDAHIMEVLMTLCAGAALYIVPDDIRKNLTRLSKFYQSNDITIAIFTPAMLRELDPKDFPKLRAIISTGEKVDEITVERWSKMEDGRSRLFINGYGPSEVTIATTLGICKPGEKVHIGYPITGLEVFVLQIQPDDSGLPANRVPKGEEGELYIAGPFALARGYADEELTRKRFRVISHPDYPQKKIRVFQTRDKARINENGQLEVLGRLDRQIKAYGKIICPEEIDNLLLNADSNVANVYVDAHINDHGHPDFIAYLQLRDKKITRDFFLSLYKTIVAKLTATMAPARWVIVDEIPLTPSKKIDTKKMPTLGSLTINRLQSVRQIFPRNTLEREIAAIWQDVLEITEPNFQFSIHDNFLYLGGTSIRCAKLLQILRGKYSNAGVKFNLTLAEFIQSPTIASLARIITKLRQERKTSLIDLSSHFNCGKINAEAAPIYFIHSLMGDPVMDYGKLMQAWGNKSDRQVFALKAAGLENPDDMDDSLETIAQDYASTIIARHPTDRSILLAGWSAGAVIGVAICNLLQKRGRQVALFAIDGESPVFFQAKSQTDYASYLFNLFSQKLQQFFDFNEDVITQRELADLPRELQIDKLYETILAKIKEPNLAYKKGLLSTVCNLVQAILHCGFSGIITDITMVAATKTQTKWGNERLGWSNNIHFDSIIPMDGDHESIMSLEANVAMMADYLNRFCVDQDNLFNTRKIVRRILQQAPFEREDTESYVPLEGYCETNPGVASALFTDDESGEVNKFLKGGKPVFLLFGDSVSGKTRFLKHMAHKLWQHHKKDGPVVLYIPLNVARANPHLLVEQRLREFGLNDEEINHVKEHQEFIFVLDDCHETTAKPKQNLYALYGLGKWKAKIIVSCNNSYLCRVDRDYARYFYPSSATKLTAIDPVVARIAPLNTAQRKNHIKLLLTDLSRTTPVDTNWQDPEKYLHYINLLGLSDLLDLPFVFPVLVEILPKVVMGGSSPENSTAESQTLIRTQILNAITTAFWNHKKNKLLLAGKMPQEDYEIRGDFVAFNIALANKMNQEGTAHVVYKPNDENWRAFFGNEISLRVMLAREGALVRQMSIIETGEQIIRFIDPALVDYFVNYQKPQDDIWAVQDESEKYTTGKSDFSLLVEEPTELNGNYKRAWEIITPQICYHIETGTFPEHAAFDQKISEALRLLSNNRKGILDWLQTHQGTPERLALAQTLLQVALAFIEENYNELYARIYHELLWNDYQRHLAEVDLAKDVFCMSPVVLHKFQLAEQLSHGVLMQWWDEIGKLNYFAAFLESQYWGNKIELRALAAYLDINIRFKKAEVSQSRIKPSSLQVDAHGSLENLQKPFLSVETGEAYQPIKLVYKVTELDKLMEILSKLQCCSKREGIFVWNWYWQDECNDMNFSSLDSFQKDPQKPLRIGVLIIRDGIFYINLPSFKRATVAVEFFSKVIGADVAEVYKAIFVNRVFGIDERLPPNFSSFFDEEEAERIAQERTETYENVTARASAALTVERKLAIMSEYSSVEAKKPLPSVEAFLFQNISNRTNEDPETKFLGFYIYLRGRELVSIRRWFGSKDFTLADAADETMSAVFAESGYTIDDSEEETMQSASSSTERANYFYKRGAAHYSEQHYDQAIQDYTRAIDLDSSEAVYFGNRANAHSAIDHNDQAIEDYTQAICLNPNKALYFGRRGDLYYSTGRYVLATQDYTHAISLSPDEALYYGDRGYLYYLTQCYDQAIQDFMQAISLDPTDSSNLNCLGFVYLIKDDLEQAEKYFSQTLALTLQDEDTLRRQRYAHIGLQFKKWLTKDAEKLVTSFFIDTYDMFEQPYRRVFLCFELLVLFYCAVVKERRIANQPEKLKATYRDVFLILHRAIQDHTREPTLFFGLAKLFLLIGATEQARKSLTICLSINSHFTSAESLLQDCENNNKEILLPEFDLQSLPVIEFDDFAKVDAQSSAASSVAAEKNSEGAINLQALGFQSTDAAKFHNMACLHHVRGEYEFADQNFQNALKLQKSASTYCDYGFFLLARSNLEEAVKCFLQAIVRGRDKSELFYSKEERALFDQHLQQTFAQADLTIKPFFMAQYWLILCCEQLHDLELRRFFLGIFEAAVKNNPDDKNNYLVLSCAYRGINDDEKADELMAYALSLEGRNVSNEKVNVGSHEAVFNELVGLVRDNPTALRYRLISYCYAAVGDEEKKEEYDALAMSLADTSGVDNPSLVYASGVAEVTGGYDPVFFKQGNNVAASSTSSSSSSAAVLADVGKPVSFNNSVLLSLLLKAQVKVNEQQSCELVQIVFPDIELTKQFIAALSAIGISKRSSPGYAVFFNDDNEIVHCIIRLSTDEYAKVKKHISNQPLIPASSQTKKNNQDDGNDDDVDDKKTDPVSLANLSIALTNLQKH
jgi:amino acid adenylation domain-containing protein